MKVVWAVGLAEARNPSQHRLETVQRIKSDSLYKLRLYIEHMCLPDPLATAIKKDLNSPDRRRIPKRVITANCIACNACPVTKMDNNVYLTGLIDGSHLYAWGFGEN